MGIWLAPRVPRGAVEADIGPASGRQHTITTSNDRNGLGGGSAVEGSGSFKQRSRALRPSSVVAGREPAAHSIGSDERDRCNHPHDVSILIAVDGRVVGLLRGGQPASNSSMMTMRPPQHGQGWIGFSVASVPADAASGFVDRDS